MKHSTLFLTLCMFYTTASNANKINLINATNVPVEFKVFSPANKMSNGCPYLGGHATDDSRTCYAHCCESGCPITVAPGKTTEFDLYSVHDTYAGNDTLNGAYTGYTYLSKTDETQDPVDHYHGCYDLCISDVTATAQGVTISSSGNKDWNNTKGRFFFGLGTSFPCANSINIRIKQKTGVTDFYFDYFRD